MWCKAATLLSRSQSVPANGRRDSGGSEQNVYIWDIGAHTASELFYRDFLIFFVNILWESTFAVLSWDFLFFFISLGSSHRLH